MSIGMWDAGLAEEIGGVGDVDVLSNFCKTNRVGTRQKSISNVQGQQSTGKQKTDLGMFINLSGSRTFLFPETTLHPASIHLQLLRSIDQ